MPHKIHRVLRDEELRQHITRAREVIAMCLEVLGQPRPDTFLGRQHHELTPPSCYQDDEGDDFRYSEPL